jgi:uncharacterized protein (TIGR00730 family)
MSDDAQPPRWICVFCGARSGSLSAYTEAAQALGEAMADKGINLVYGGSGLGIMSTVANAVLDRGGQATGVIPHHLIEKEEVAGRSTQLYVVKSMHERKSLMYRMSDAFLVLPGGYGSMDELMEVLTWSKLELHDKPVALLNIAGYYDALLQWFDHARDSGFIGAGDRELVQASDTVEGVLKVLGWE